MFKSIMYVQHTSLAQGHNEGRLPICALVQFPNHRLFIKCPPSAFHHAGFHGCYPSTLSVIEVTGTGFWGDELLPH